MSYPHTHSNSYQNQGFVMCDDKSSFYKLKTIVIAMAISVHNGANPLYIAKPDLRKLDIIYSINVRHANASKLLSTEMKISAKKISRTCRFIACRCQIFTLCDPHG